jgi:hypothetical protein
MEFIEFKERFDKPGCVLLFGGKREVLEEDVELIGRLGLYLVSNTENLIFRTGNANGADVLFAEGIAKIDPSRLQSVTPYQGHRKKTNYAKEQYSLDQVDLAAEPEVVYHSKANVKTKRLVEDYVSGKRDQYAMKAAYIIRDTLMVIGGKDILRSACGLFYDDLKSPMSGGTGHTMNVCRLNHVPYYDQRTWMKWL